MGSVIPAPWRGNRWIPWSYWPVYPNQWAWDQMKHPFSKIEEDSWGRHRHWWRASACMHTHVHMDLHAQIHHTPTHMYTYINICRGLPVRCPWSLFHSPLLEHTQKINSHGLRLISSFLVACQELWTLFCPLLRRSRNRAAVIMECVSRLYLFFFFFQACIMTPLHGGWGNRVIEQARGDGHPPCFKAGALTSSSVMYKPGYSSPELLQQGKWPAL